jgi:hypothetical protein
MDKTIGSKRTHVNLDLVRLKKETEQTNKYELRSNPASKETNKNK